MGLCDVLHGALRRVVQGDAAYWIGGGWVTAGGSDLDEKMQEFGPSGIILLIFLA